MSDWYYLLDNEQKGPIAESELKGIFSANKLPYDTLIWKDGMANWSKASEVSALSLPETRSLPALPPQFTGPPPFVAPRVVCAGCKSPQVVAGHKTPLCQPCRDTLIKTPLPKWLRVSLLILGLLLVLSAARLPRELRAAVAFDRGEAADSNGQYQLAIQEYQVAIDAYPDYYDAMGNLAVSANHVGDKQKSEKYMTILRQHEYSDDNASANLAQAEDYIKRQK